MNIFIYIYICVHRLVLPPHLLHGREHADLVTVVVVYSHSLYKISRVNIAALSISICCWDVNILICFPTSSFAA